MKVGELILGSWPNYDPYHVFMGSLPYMVEQARYAAQNDSYSYRDFKVGVAVFAINQLQQSHAIFAAGNIKAKKHDKPICAELRSLTQVKKARFEGVLGLVVAGTSDVKEIEDVNDTPAPTLHPCFRCRDLFQNDPLISDETLIISVGQDRDVYQSHTSREMVDQYDGCFPPVDARANDLSVLDRGVATYDLLSMVERSLPPEERRTPAFLAKIALQSSNRAV